MVFFAAERRDIRAIRHYIRHSEDDLISCAVRSGSVELLLLMRKGCLDMRERVFFHDPVYSPTPLNSTLHIACSCGHLDAAKFLYEECGVKVLGRTQFQRSHMLQ